MPLTVNGEEISEAELREEEARLRPQLRRAMPDETAEAREARAVEWARDSVIERVLLRQAAMADPEPLPAGMVELAQQRVPEMSREEIEIRLQTQRLTARM